MTYLQAISDAMREEMRADERVLVMGEDIGVFGGAFKVTDGFIDEFGPSRVMDTPLAESGIVGTAVGAAVSGCARLPRCSSPTSSRAASTSSSTSRPRCTTARGCR
jgi:pyruvate/2-oxoglutarate/acetoin dehydrogenase E1 component